MQGVRVKKVKEDKILKKNAIKEGREEQIEKQKTGERQGRGVHSYK